MKHFFSEKNSGISSDIVGARGQTAMTVGRCRGPAPARPPSPASPRTAADGTGGHKRGWNGDQGRCESKPGKKCVWCAEAVDDRNKVSSPGVHNYST